MESYLRNTTIRSLNFGNLLPMFRFFGEVGPLRISASAGRPCSREVRARGCSGRRRVNGHRGPP